MQVTIDLHLHYKKRAWNANDMMKQEFYKAKDFVFGLGYEEYVEEHALPLDPINSNIFHPLATYRVRDATGNYSWINIYAKGLGGMLVTDEF